LSLAAYSPLHDSALLLFLLLQGIGLGPFHVGLTWSHFLDKRIRSDFLDQKSKGINMAILFSILILSVAGYCIAPVVVTCIYVIWTVQHIVQQNVGVLLLYQNYDGRHAVLDRSAAITSLHSAGWLFSFLFLRHFAGAGFQQLMLLLCGVLAAYQMIAATSCVATDLGMQIRNGKIVSRPMVCFWLLSLVFLTPLALCGTKFYEALLVPLVMHWFQYIGLNFCLASRKGRKEDSRMLGVWAMILTGLCFCVIMLGSGIGALQFTTTTLLGRILVGFGMALTLLHYAQDAFLWRFKNSVMRERLLHFLKGPPQPICSGRSDVRALLSSAAPLAVPGPKN
jgi:hypothetical protein